MKVFGIFWLFFDTVCENMNINEKEHIFFRTNIFLLFFPIWIKNSQGRSFSDGSVRFFRIDEAFRLKSAKIHKLFFILTQQELTAI